MIGRAYNITVICSGNIILGLLIPRVLIRVKYYSIRLMVVDPQKYLREYKVASFLALDCSGGYSELGPGCSETPA